MKYPPLRKKRTSPRQPTWAEALGFTVAVLLLWTMILLYVVGILGW